MPTAPEPRREFLRKTALATVGASLARVALRAGDALAEENATRNENQQPVHRLTTEPLERVRVAIVGCGGRGNSHLGDLLALDFVDIVAVCDLRTDRANRAAERIAKARESKPQVFGGQESSWEPLCEIPELDVVYLATPWEWHVPMALRAMEHRKHAFVEVPAAVTLDDCWRLVNTSEKTQRHCVLLENCCYGENELLVMNLVREGVFGELKHAECAYLHDLRSTLFDLSGEGEWRRNFHTKLDGNLYPTHGLGPVAQYLGIGCGDQFKFLVSMSSPELSLSKFRAEHHPNGGQQDAEVYRCGDLNSTLIKTELGRTILVQHDTVSPRPYSRINGLMGTSGAFFDYPARLALDNPRQYGLEGQNAHGWLSGKDLQAIRDKFTHPLWSKLRDDAKQSGHGGMDFVMNWRHLTAIRLGHTPDSVVYDTAAWSSIIELSAQSVSSGSQPVPMPDFTRGLWKSIKPVPISAG